MADVNRGARPLSPHLMIYRPQFTAITSSFHRLTGIALAGSGVLIVWWFLAAATGPEYFEFANGVLTSWFGDILLTLSLWAISYHLLNGIRHLAWDFGKGLDLASARRSAYVVGLGSFVLTALVVILL